jgi:hypothetical protein
LGQGGRRRVLVVVVVDDDDLLMLMSGAVGAWVWMGGSGWRVWAVAVLRISLLEPLA